MYLSWKEDPKSVHRVGNYSILYVSKVHGNILFIVRKATRSSWDAIPREKVKDIFALKQWVLKKTQLF